MVSGAVLLPPPPLVPPPPPHPTMSRARTVTDPMKRNMMIPLSYPGMTPTVRTPAIGNSERFRLFMTLFGSFMDDPMTI